MSTFSCACTTSRWLRTPLETLSIPSSTLPMMWEAHGSLIPSPPNLLEAPSLAFLDAFLQFAFCRLSFDGSRKVTFRRGLTLWPQCRCTTQCMPSCASSWDLLSPTITTCQIMIASDSWRVEKLSTWWLPFLSPALGWQFSQETTWQAFRTFVIADLNLGVCIVYSRAMDDEPRSRHFVDQLSIPTDCQE